MTVSAARARGAEAVPLQRKLAIGSASDPLETEADAIADRMMDTPVLRRKCACEDSGAPCEQCQKETLQRKETAATAARTAPVSVHHALSAPGEALDGATRAFMEPRFGRDFSRVRVHMDRAAANSARDVSALAYTVGHDIVFGAERYAPHTPRCNAADSTADLWRKIQMWAACITARTAINAICYRGGNRGHREQLANAVTALTRCWAIYEGRSAAERAAAQEGAEEAAEQAGKKEAATEATEARARHGSHRSHGSDRGNRGRRSGGRRTRTGRCAGDRRSPPLVSDANV